MSSTPAVSSSVARALHAASCTCLLWSSTRASRPCRKGGIYTIKKKKGVCYKIFENPANWNFQMGGACLRAHLDVEQKQDL